MEEVRSAKIMAYTVQVVKDIMLTASRGSHAVDFPTLAAQVFPKSSAPVS